MTTTSRRSRFGVVCSALIAAVLLAACNGAPVASTATRGSAPQGSTPAPSSGTSGAQGEKLPLRGLIDMGIQTAYQSGQPFPVTDPSTLDAYAGAFTGIVVNESWSQLEPAPGVQQWGPLDKSLAAVSAWNAAHPSTPLGVKLRIFAGRGAPAWVASQSGTVAIDVHGRKVAVGKWWTQPFESAWHSFQLALAARYDSDALVRQVSVSSCSSSTGEPFVVSGALISQADLKAAGWTPQAQEQCLSGALSDYSGWRHTPVTFAFNPIPTGQGPDAAFMDQEMQQCAASAAQGGPECIVGNNDLSPNVANSRYSGPAVAQIQHLQAGASPPTVYFQTVGARLDCQTIATGLTYHAQSIELWPPNGRYLGFSAQSPATLSQWSQALISGVSPSC